MTDTDAVTAIASVGLPRATVDTAVRLTVRDAAGAHAHLPGSPPMSTLGDPDGSTLVLVRDA